MAQQVYFTVQYQGFVEVPDGIDPEDFLYDMSNAELLALSETKMSIQIDSVEETA